MGSIVDRVDRLMALQRESELIRCPKCGTVKDDTECEHISCYGEDEPVEYECDECETQLVVVETVTRTYEVTIKEGD